MPFGLWQKEAFKLPLFNEYVEKVYPFYCDPFWDQPGFGSNAYNVRHNSTSSKVL